jgi:hypothetical protein
MTGVVTFGLPTMNSLVFAQGEPHPACLVAVVGPAARSCRHRARRSPGRPRRSVRAVAANAQFRSTSASRPTRQAACRPSPCRSSSCGTRNLSWAKACPQTSGDWTKQSDPLPHGRQVLPTPESFAALDDRSRGGSRCLLGRTLAIPSCRRRLRNCESADQGSPRPHTPADYEQRTRRPHGAPCGSTAAPSRVEDY